MKDRISFLWETLKYQENRIAMVDTKASAVIAIEMGLLAIVAFVVEKTGYLDIYQWFGFGTIAISGFWTGFVILLLLQTIRPARLVFCRKVSIPKRLDSDNLIWPRCMPSEKEFLNIMSALTIEKQETELKAEIYAHYFLLRRKYNIYSLALQIAKIQVTFIFIALGSLAISKFVAF